MKRWMPSLAVAFCSLAAAPGAACSQEKYTIKVKQIGPGESLRAEAKEIVLYKTETAIEKEKTPAKPDEQKTTKHVVFTETVLERPDPAKMPTKIKRVYEKAEIEGKLFDGEGKPQRPYHGKTILIEKKNGGIVIRIEGGEVLKDVQELENEFTGGDPDAKKWLFLHTQPVSVGDTWKVDPGPLLHGFKKDEKVDVQKAKGSGKLTKVYKKDGRLYGVIESEVEVHLKVDVNDPKVKGQLSSEQKTVMKMTFDGCIDGTFAAGHVVTKTDFTSTTVFRGKDQPAVTTTLTGMSSDDSTWMEVPPKK